MENFSVFFSFQIENEKLLIVELKRWMEKLNKKRMRFGNFKKKKKFKENNELYEEMEFEDF